MKEQSPEFEGGKSDIETHGSIPRPQEKKNRTKKYDIHNPHQDHDVKNIAKLSPPSSRLANQQVSQEDSLNQDQPSESKIVSSGMTITTGKESYKTPAIDHSDNAKNEISKNIAKLSPPSSRLANQQVSQEDSLNQDQPSESKIVSSGMTITTGKESYKTPAIDHSDNAKNEISKNESHPTEDWIESHEKRSDEDMVEAVPLERQVYYNVKRKDAKRIESRPVDYVVNITIENIDVRAIMQQKETKKEHPKILSLEEYQNQKGRLSR